MGQGKSCILNLCCSFNLQDKDLSPQTLFFEGVTFQLGLGPQVFSTVFMMTIHKQSGDTTFYNCTVGTNRYTFFYNQVGVIIFALLELLFAV